MTVIVSELKMGLLRRFALTSQMKLTESITLLQKSKNFLRRVMLQEVELRTSHLH